MVKQLLMLFGLAVVVSLVARPFQEKRISFWGFPEPMKLLSTSEVFAAESVSPDSAFAPAEQAYAVNLAQVSQLYMKRKKSGVHFIDARLPSEYAEGHIPGALNVSQENLSEHAARLDSVPKGDLIVLYCDGGDCHKSHDLAEYMLQNGWKRLAVYEGGWAEWSQEMDAVETSGN